MKLEPLTLDQCQRVRTWRNNEMEVWRTPFMLTEEMQAEFYHKRVCNRDSEHRYWAIMGEKGKGEDTHNIHDIKMPINFFGMGGITYIQWENRIGEITLIIAPELRKDGLGEKAVDLLLDQAFNHLNLQTIFGEVYLCNEARHFWEKITKNYNGYLVSLPRRKYWQGTYHPSWYFSIDKDDFNIGKFGNKMRTKKEMDELNSRNKQGQ